MAPKIDSGDLFLASGATFAKQQADRKLRRTQKRSRDKAKTSPRAPKTKKSQKTGRLHSCLGGGSAAEAGSVKAFLADRQDEHRLRGVKIDLIHALTASGGRRIFRLPPLPPTFQVNDDGG